MCWTYSIVSLHSSQTHLLLTHPSLFKKILQDQFMLPKYSRMSGLPLKCGLFTKGENHLPLPQQLTKADSPTARCRVVCTAPLPCCHIIWLGLAQVLYIWCLNCCELISAAVQMTVFLATTAFCLDTLFFCPLFWSDPWALGCGTCVISRI